MAWANPGVSLSSRERRRAARLVQPRTGRTGCCRRSRRSACARAPMPSFAAALRHNMRHAGAVRIDHVMGLRRLFWISEGGAPTDGAYVRYPFDDLVRIIALVVGAAPLPGDRRGPRHRAARLSSADAARRAGVLPGSLLRAGAGAAAFLAPAAYPRQALVSVSTHDLPTLKGYWTGRDIRWRTMLQRFSDGDALQSTPGGARARPGPAPGALEQGRAAAARDRPGGTAGRS